MNRFLFFLLLTALLSFSSKILAQNAPSLSLDEAVQRALSRNLGVKILENDVKVAKNNAVKGNAGFLPNVNFQAGLTPSFGFLNQNLASGTEINRFNLSNNLNAGVQLSWLLYDGRRMHLELDRLRELQNVGEISLFIRSENLMYDVMRAYNNVLRQEALYKGLEEQMTLFEERFRLAQTRLDVGRGNQLDVFQAQSDLNTQKTALTRQNQAIAMAKMLVNQLMMDETTLNFATADSLILNESIDFEQLKRDAVGKNNTLNLLKRQRGIAILTQKEAETFKKPRIVANSAFNLGRTDNTAGFLLLNQTAGLNAGITLTYPLYDGGNIKRQIENAKIATESSGLQIKEAEYNIVSNLNLAFQTYKNALEILRGEEENIKISRQSIEIAMERFRLSRSTILELRQIQQSYEAALIRAISARFDAKNAEIDLLWLSGNLVKR